MTAAQGYPLGVTTARTERCGQRELALTLAAQLHARFVDRANRGLERLLTEEQLASVVLVNEEGICWLDAAGRRFFWHPNMAFVRIRSAKLAGLPDPIVRASGLAPGDRLLDATLGLGADAIVAAESLGPDDEVVGLEASPIVAALVQHGLATYQHKWQEPLRRIRVVCGDHRELLRNPDFTGPGFAVICFDPMFEHPVESSNGLDGVRQLACYDRLEPETLALARTLVSKAVLLKVRTFGSAAHPSPEEQAWLDELGAARLVSGRHNRVGYAVFEPV